jgi:hypothetical protein
MANRRNRSPIDLIGNIGAATAIVDPGVVTISQANPGVVTYSGADVWANGDPIELTTTGALPTGLSTGTTYYIVNLNTGANTFNLAATVGGAGIQTTSAGSGTHTAHHVPALGITDGVFVGTAGALAVTMADGVDATFVAAPAGYHPIRVQKVLATTAALGVLALYA